MSFLSDQKWQGIGAISSVGCLIIAYLALVQGGRTEPLTAAEPTEAEQRNRPDGSGPVASPTSSTSYKGTVQRHDVDAESTRATANDVHPSPTRGGVTVVISGFEETDTEMRSMVVEELQHLEWTGLAAGGPKELHVTGVIRNEGMTLGQIPTAGGSASWELRTRSGAFLGQGAVAGRLGTGQSEVEARSAATRLIAKQVARDIVRSIP